jgi:hypothetical protein
MSFKDSIGAIIILFLLFFGLNACAGGEQQQKKVCTVSYIDTSGVLRYVEENENIKIFQHNGYVSIHDRQANKEIGINGNSVMECVTKTTHQQ